MSFLQGIFKDSAVNFNLFNFIKSTREGTCHYLNLWELKLLNCHLINFIHKGNHIFLMSYPCKLEQSL